MSILIVEYPKPPKPTKPKRRHLADAATAARLCPKCNGVMHVRPNGEVKTMSPPLYLFECPCGYNKWGHHQDEVSW